MSFSASLSGLNANQQQLSVIGNNLANLNTTAFKASTANFSDLVSQSVGGSSANPMQIGLGVTTGSISPNFSQGGMQNTGVPTNVAIQGSGMFVIGDNADRSYSRAGDFSFNANGMLVTPDGKAVQGYTVKDPATGAIVTTGQPTSVVVPPGVLRAPVTTTQFTTNSNLNAGAAVGDEFTSSVQIYDSVGAAHVATITYVNTGNGAWTYDIGVDGSEIQGGTPGTPSSLGNGTLSFDASGKLVQVDGAAAANVTITGPVWADGAAATDITWALLDANGTPSVSGFTAASATSSVTQNGAAAASISGIRIDSAGQIIASFGTGQSVTVGQLALANFNNPGGLVKAGSNLFVTSQASGLASIGVAGTGGRGVLIGSSLEQSNVDIATEFTQMILAQRGYEANSKGITVADQILQATLNLIR
ncbi:MAG: flagellar hook protein FlgE [Acidobacteriota bacterium]